VLEALLEAVLATAGFVALMILTAMIRGAWQ
jgi:hypothetical protein